MREGGGFIGEQPGREVPLASRPEIPAVSEREQAWLDEEQKVEGLTDRLGQGIEAGIRDAVVGLRLLGINTVGSCEGHLDWGLPAPWVDVEAPDKPDERFAGEKDVYRALADRHGIPVDEISHWETDLGQSLWEEAWNSLVNSDTPETPEFLRWSVESIDLAAQVDRLLGEFYSGREADPDVRIVIDRSGRIHNGGELYERSSGGKRDESDRAAIAERLPLYRAEMDGFARFLRERFLRS